MACFLGFDLSLCLGGETATLLRKLGLCFLSPQEYFSQVRSGLRLWLSGLAFQPSKDQRSLVGETVPSCGHSAFSAGLLPLHLSLCGGVGGACRVRNQMDVSCSSCHPPILCFLRGWTSLQAGGRRRAWSSEAPRYHAQKGDSRLGSLEFSLYWVLSLS